MTPIDVAGLTLLHFLWEGALCAAAAALALQLLHRRSPQARYATACGAMGFMLAAPLVTAAILSRTETAPAAPVAAARANVPSGSLTAADSTASRSAGGADSATPSVFHARPSPQLGALVAVWLSGVAILFVRFVVGWRSIRRLRQTAMHSQASYWSATAQRIASSLDLHWPIRVVDSFDVDTPTVVGWLKPLILLPVAGLANLTPAQIEAIVAHELAHVRRHDCLVNLLQVVAEALLFYHPAVWWISARIRVEREHCCDDIAASVSGDVVAYAEALVELERWRAGHHSLAIAATDGPLLARIRRLLRPSSIEAPRSAAMVSITGLAVVLICLWGAAQYLRASQLDPSSQTLTEPDEAAAWSMVFNHDDLQMRFIGFRSRDLVRFAYQVPAARVVGGPSWIDDDIPELVTTIDREPRADAMPGLVRRLLEDRLQLRTHVERRNFPVLALQLARPDGSLGPNLRASTIDCFDLQEWIDAGQPARSLPPSAPRQPVCGEMAWDTPFGHRSYVAITMPQFAQELRHTTAWPISPTRRPRDVVDRTGLAGRFDIDFESFVLTAALMTRYPTLTTLLEPVGFTSIPRALEDQLGLTLRDAEAPFDVIVIDGAERP